MRAIQFAFWTISFNLDNSRHVCAFYQHIEVAFAQSWCSLCCLFLIWRDAEQHQFRIIVAQNVNEFGGI